MRNQARAHPSAWGWAAAMVLWACWMTVALVVRDGRSAPVLYDEWFYWNLADTFTDSFVGGYTDQARGVWFPRVIAWIASGAGVVDLGARGTAFVVTIVCLPLLTAVIAPSLAKSLGSRTRVGVGRILALNVLVLLLWRNDAIRLLSDFPSLTAFAGGAALVAWLARHPSTSWTRVVVLGAAAGATFAFAANVRPAYLLVTVAAVLLLPLLLWGSGWRRTAGVLAVVLVGIGIGFAPQVAVNRNQGVSWSVVPVESGTLARRQLQFGLEMQRYDTYIGPESAYPSKKMVFDNEANLDGLDPDDVDSVPAYLRTALARPTVIAESVARHAFNGLDIRWPGTYVEDVHEPMVPTQVLNFSVLVLASGVLGIRAWRWWRRRPRRPDGTSWAASGAPVRIWFGLVLAAVTAPALATAVETRFLLPLHVFLLAVVALGASRADLPERVGVRVAALGGAGVLVVALVALSSSVARSLEPPLPLRAPASAPSVVVVPAASPPPGSG